MSNEEKLKLILQTLDGIREECPDFHFCFSFNYSDGENENICTVVTKGADEETFYEMIHMQIDMHAGNNGDNIDDINNFIDNN